MENQILEKAEQLPGGEKIVEAAHTAAAAIEDATDYLREQDWSEMLSDARELMKRHPGAMLLTAAAVGFLLARSVARN
ncbi:MAG TPA: hypothetical protein VM146_07925 [Steroidobacteraceae bacterium]|nr:hypothetical protein [Steroidobacteraceae bacterium]